ncbi:MAG: signal peptidase I [Tissierellia bacterium]|nr:signal peptidase I [Tissierellia bacterium]
MKNNLFVTKSKRKSILTEIIEWIKTFVITFILLLFIFGNVFSTTGIKGPSMEPNFFEGERVFIYNLGYYFSESKRGDVVVLSKHYSEKGLIINTITVAKDLINNISNMIKKEIEVKYIVKRVIGLPGDTIDIKDGYVYLNGNRLEENYVKGQTFERLGLSYPITIPENKVFVLGDNREVSLDSRDLGLISYDQIKGKVTFRLLPISRFGKIH